MDDVALIEPGRWGFSRIIDDGGGWTTHAMQERLATGIQAKYPPLVNGAYPVPYALVRLTGSIITPATNDTILFPRNLDLSKLTLGDLTAAQRNNLRNFLETLLGYQFTDYDKTPRIVDGMDVVVASYTTSTLVRDLLRDAYRYLGHTSSRLRFTTPENHNTEYTDNFDDNPMTSRWTTQPGCTGGTYNSGTADWVVDGDNAVGKRYSVNNAGSIEHEAQITSSMTSTGLRAVGPGVRMVSGAHSAYGVSVDSFRNYQLWKYISGTRTELESADLGANVTVGHWLTMRLAAAGGNGANVVLSFWLNDHATTTKPSDPGWFGVDGSPTETYTDTAADRLDDDTTNIYQGLVCRGNVGGNSTSDFFKLRAISDRGGAAVGAFPFQSQHPMAHMLVR